MHENQQTARLYLLGLLDEEARLRLEERLLTDDLFYEELLVSEQELCEDYLAGRLTPDERGQFESYFLATPERRRQLNVTRAFRRYVSDHAADPARESETTPARETVMKSDAESAASRVAVARERGPRTPFWQRLLPSPALRFSAAWALLLVVIGGATLLYLKPWQPSTPDAGVELARLNEQAHSRQMTDAERAAYVRVDAAAGGLTRGEGRTHRVTLPPGAPGARLRFELPGDEFETYRAQLKTAGGDSPAHVVEDLRPVREDGARVVLLYVPARLLPPGDYQVKLGGRTPSGQFEDLSTHSFRVVGQ